MAGRFTATAIRFETMRRRNDAKPVSLTRGYNPSLFWFEGLVARDAEVTFPFQKHPLPIHQNISACILCAISDPRSPWLKHSSSFSIALSSAQVCCWKARPAFPGRLLSHQPGSTLRIIFFVHNEGKASVGSRVGPAAGIARLGSHWVSPLFCRNPPAGDGGGDGGGDWVDGRAQIFTPSEAAQSSLVSRNGSVWVLWVPCFAGSEVMPCQCCCAFFAVESVPSGCWKETVTKLAELQDRKSFPGVTSLG